MPWKDAADQTSITKQANSPGIYGASEKNKIFYKNASKSKVAAIYKGIAVSRITGVDFSSGGYFWHGNDFYRSVNWSKAHEYFYLVGFKYTSPIHDIWGIGNHISGTKGFTYKYQSTAAYGQTTFMKLTIEWMKFSRAKHWSGK